MKVPSQAVKLAGRTGFTLIELLIVVAIIAILAAIAVPNFLEAQTRSKVSRTRADMRTLATAIESYFVDQNRYPTFSNFPQPFSVNGGGNPTTPDMCARSEIGLTSPIAYITSIPADPFGGVLPGDDFTFNSSTTVADAYYYNTQEWFVCRGFAWTVFPTGNNPPAAKWVLQSKGPDKFFSRSAVTGIPGADELDRPYLYAYDPTNGTISVGNIIRSGP
jgi:type II secretion system protein G